MQVAQLADWLGANGLDVSSPELTPVGGGHSNPTYTLSLDGGQRVVLRRPPDGPLPPSTHDVLREARWLRGLAATGVPVPAVLAICEDTGVIGVPFYVMAFIDGFVPPHGMPRALEEPEKRRELAFRFVDALAELHAVDTGRPGIAEFRRPGSYLERQLERFGSLWERNRTRPMPAMDEVSAWLLAERPETHRDAVVHGDARPGNALFRLTADGVQVVGLLDWEMAAIGDPLADVGYFLATWAEAGDQDDPLLGVSTYTRDHGYPTRDELAAHYAARTGLATSDITYYVVLALWKAVVVMEGNYRRFREGTAQNPYFATYEDGLPHIAERARSLAGLADRPFTSASKE
jgi:aminoglycoside phosphotransferase (APT) family kinase protein